MKMFWKIVLGIVTIMPIILFGSMFAIFFSQMFNKSMFQQAHTPVAPGTFPPMPKVMMVMFGIEIVAFMIIFALLIFYIINVFKNPKLPKDKRALWAVVLFLGHVISMPVYWYLYIWREPSPTLNSPS